MSSNLMTLIRDRTPLKKGQISTGTLRDEFRRDPALPILADDEIFKKAIRKGVDAGEYVYRRGDLLYGKGDPFTTIQIDQDAIVFTMGFANQNGIWPRPEPKPAAADPLPTTGTGTFTGFGETGSRATATGYTAQPGQPEGMATGGLSGSQGTESSGSTASPSSGPADRGVLTFSAEGILKEALKILWEQARSKKVNALGKLGIDMYDAGDAFRLLGAVGAVPNARKRVILTGGYETANGSSMEISFEGTPDDAKPVKDFVEPQLRAAKEKSLKASFTLVFDGGLSMSGDAAEKLAERLAKFASGAAYVSATAEAAPATTEAAPEKVMA